MGCEVLKIVNTLLQEKNTLLVTCLEGQTLEIEAPESDNFDTTHTFEITGLKTLIHTFKSVKSQLRVSYSQEIFNAKVFLSFQRRKHVS